MKNRSVKELMVPLSEYARVPETATLMEAVRALEQAQAEFDGSRYRHRAVMVTDDQSRVVGKLSQLDVLRALEPKYKEIGNPEGMAHLGFTRKFLKSMLGTYHLWDMPLNDICQKGADRRVREFMYTPQEGEYVEANATLDEAIHQLLMGRHQSLLVTENDEVVGILRLTDVFAEVTRLLSACQIEG
jgi:CBS domain-containing protein